MFEAFVIAVACFIGALLGFLLGPSGFLFSIAIGLIIFLFIQASMSVMFWVVGWGILLLILMEASFSDLPEDDKIIDDSNRKDYGGVE